MKTKSYWRGFVDSQGKTDYQTGEVIATSRNKKLLAELAEVVGSKVEEYRSGYFVSIPKLDKVLPKTINVEYLAGWFAGSGQRYKKPLKLTVTGTNVEQFGKLVKDKLNIDLPKAQLPSSTSKSKRIIITGEKARKLDKCLNA